MKAILVVLLILGLAFACCKKEPMGFTSDIDLQQLLYWQDGYFCTATKEVPDLGQIDWTANAVADIHLQDSTKFGLVFRTYQDTTSGEGDTREFLQLGEFEFRTGTQEISIGTYARLLSDGDVLDAFWKLDESSDKTVTIDEINRTEKYIKGHFSVKFKMKTQGYAHKHSEHINFLNAVFRARLIE